MAELERIYTVPLKEAYEHNRRLRARTAVRELRHFLLRHMKTDTVKISGGLNDYLWSHGMTKPPRKVKIRVKKDAAGIAHASLLSERPEEKPKEKTPKVAVPEKKKEETKPKAEIPPAPEKKEAKSAEISSVPEKK